MLTCGKNQHYIVKPPIKNKYIKNTETFILLLCGGLGGLKG